MKILSVEGENITSLENFRVAFDEPPLSNHGVFAITGPTGAGKSTLLDAICLAFYNTTPRLKDDTPVQVGRTEADVDQLRSNDPRGILRRGTAKGWIKVRFQGRDRQVYRAEWELKRARERTDGKLQEVSHRIYNEQSQEVLASSKTETLRVIQEKVGLTFDQFRRTVLLAQGDFAAFLKGNARERAELLEKLTGQDIYSKISALAFNRAKQAKLNLDQQEQEIARLNEKVMSPEAQELMARNCEEAEENVERLKKMLEEVEAAFRWYEQDLALGKEEEEARLQRVHADGLRMEAEPLKNELAEVEAAEDCRMPLYRFEEALKQQQEAVRRTRLASEALMGAKERSTRCIHLAEEAEASYNNIEEVWKTLAPQITNARRLDTLLLSAHRNTDDAQQRHQKEVAALTALQQRQQKLQSDLQKAVLQHASERSWCEIHAEDGILAQNWPLLQAQLLELSSHLQQQKDLTKKLPALQQVVAKRATELQNARELQQGASEQLIALQNSLEASEKACIPLPPLMEHRNQLNTQLRSLESLKNALQQGEELGRQKLEREQSANDAKKASEEALLKANTGEARVQRQKEELLNARRQHEATIQVQHLLSLREKLKDGQACPLCGAKEHPSKDQPLQRLQKDTEALVKRLEIELSEQQKQVAADQATAKLQQKNADKARQEAEEFSQKLEKVRQGYRKLREELLSAGGEISGPPSEGIPAAKLLVEEKIKASDKEIQEANRLEAAVRSLRLEVEKQRSGVETFRNKVESAKIDAEKAEKLLEDCQRKGEELGERVQLLRTQLPPVWQVEADHPTELLERLGQKVLQWEEHRARRDRAERECEQVQLQVKELEIQVEAYKSNVEEAEKGAAAYREEEEKLKRERAICLGGRPAKSVEAEAQSERRRMQGEQEKARSNLAAAQAEQSLAEEQERQALEEERKRQISLAILLAELHQVLGKRNQEEVARVLKRDRAWVTESRSRLKSLEEGAARAAALFEERTRKRMEHQERRPERERSEVEHLRKEGETEQKLAVETARNLRDALVQDLQFRKRLEECLAPLELAKKEQRRWNCLDELIGSADGAKFRAFAQGLTLELLISLANNNLQNFSDRYLLARAPNMSTEAKGDMNLQIIDKSMGNEIRPVSSLSGGELFLVSLAMALGLSSLASHRQTRVETVFIDEGFGSLDARTLDVALSALEALQAEGRQVGIVSHVSGLNERVGVQVRVKKIRVDSSRVETVGR